MWKWGYIEESWFVRKQREVDSWNIRSKLLGIGGQEQVGFQAKQTRKQRE